MANPPLIHWDALHAELVATLSDYLRVNTSNPPGGEEAAARFLGRILEREGIPTEYYEAAPGRTSLRAVIPGDGSRAPLVLLNHTDVVPAEQEFWEAPAFGGVIKASCLWGRGALDMKGMGILELMVVLLCKRLQLPLRRDLVYLAVADEETGGSMGIEYLDARHPTLFSQAEYCLNEGGMGMFNFLGSRRPVFACSPVEKGACWVTLRTQGLPGHGSVPHKQNAVDRLVRALHAVLQWQRTVTVQPLTNEVIEHLRRAQAWPDPPPTIDHLADTYPIFGAMLSNTISLTSAGGGFKHNVIPAAAQATLDCRLLPGESHDAFLRDMRAVIDDPAVDLEVVFQSSSPTSDYGSELVQIIHEVVREQVEDALVLPVTSVYFTDSRVLRRRGINAYGFIPTLMDAALFSGMHGHNERIPLDGLRTGVQILFEVVRRAAA